MQWPSQSEAKPNDGRRAGPNEKAPRPISMGWSALPVETSRPLSDREAAAERNLALCCTCCWQRRTAHAIKAPIAAAAAAIPAASSEGRTANHVCRWRRYTAGGNRMQLSHGNGGERKGRGYMERAQAAQAMRKGARNRGSGISSHICFPLLNCDSA